MATGFLVDAVAGLKKRTYPIWIEGEAIWSAVWGYQTKGKSRFGVTVFRCKGCGLLESYATAPEE
jgi:hypothetical protein